MSPKILALPLVLAAFATAPPLSAAAPGGANETLASADTLKPVVPNRTLPPIEHPVKFVLPQNPSAADFAKCAEFTVPLTPVGEPTTQENADLAVAVWAALADLKKVNLAPFDQFLATHPTSAWRPAVLVNQSIAYFGSGYFSKAVASSKEAWELSKHLEDPDGHAMADRALAEYLKLSSRLGRLEDLERTFAEIKDRKISPDVGTWVTSAYESMHAMKTNPGFCFRCGPMALRQILELRKLPPSEWMTFIDDTRSPLQGFSLAEVQAMSDKLGMKLQMAYREPGAEVLIPAVVHWKVGHYAALTEKTSTGDLLTQDYTFDRQTLLSPEAFDHEASGYFLVPEGKLPAGWKSVTPEDGGKIFGKGNVGQLNKLTGGCKDAKHVGQDACSTCKGMPGWSINLVQIGLTITDTPLSYSPPVGPGIDFTMRFHEQMEPSRHPSLGSTQLMHSWLSYVYLSTPSPESDALLMTGDGSWRRFTNFDILTNQYAPEYNSGDTFKRISITPRVYELTHSDGSKEAYSVPGPTYYGDLNPSTYLASVSDAAGNTVSLTYDGYYRLMALTDAIGQVTVFSYVGSDARIALVTDPFGRSAHLEYIYPVGSSHGYEPVNRITDTLGLVSEFEWLDFIPDPNHGGGGDGSPSPPPFPIITAMITPYGRTTFTRVIDGLNRRLTATDPHGLFI